MTAESATIGERPRAALGGAPVATGLLAFIAIGAAVALYGPILPVLAERFALDAATAGFVLAAHGTGAFVGVAMCLVPGIEARMRFRPAAALLMIGLGALLFAAGLAWPLPLVGAFTIGIGFGLLTVGLNGLFARSFGRRSASMVNLLNAVFGVGAVAAPLVFVWSGGSLAVAFGALAALAFVIVPMAVAVDDRVNRISPVQTTTETPRRTESSALPMAFMFLGCGAEAAIIGWGPTILVARGAEPLDAAAASSWFFAVFLMARIVAVPLAGFVSYRTLTLSTLLALVGCCTMASIAENPTVWFAAMGIVSVVFPNAFGWMARLLEHLPNGDARIVVSALAGAAVIPLSLGFAAGLIGEAALFTALAGVLILTSLVGLAVRR